MAEHEWLEILNRRWCLGCAAFQQRESEHSDWRPSPAQACPRDTWYAQHADAGE